MFLSTTVCHTTTNLSTSTQPSKRKIFHLRPEEHHRYQNRRDFHDYIRGFRCSHAHWWVYCTLHCCSGNRSLRPWFSRVSRFGLNRMIRNEPDFQYAGIEHMLKRIEHQHCSVFATINAVVRCGRERWNLIHSMKKLLTLASGVHFFWVPSTLFIGSKLMS